MEQLKEIKLVLDLSSKRDLNIYNALLDFGKKHKIDNESEVLKSFIIFLHFVGADIKALSNKIKDIA